ncbi:hypothetical protein, partial [Cupriavidus pinatubonensis]|uniref:hypothetical protein n=1 Tax=Cupriavidus pinatubonensis TaxID=248026 RepID=UPI001C634BEB
KTATVDHLHEEIYVFQIQHSRPCRSEQTSYMAIDRTSWEACPNADIVRNFGTLRTSATASQISSGD